MFIIWKFDLKPLATIMWLAFVSLILWLNGMFFPDISTHNYCLIRIFLWLLVDFLYNSCSKNIVSKRAVLFACWSKLYSSPVWSGGKPRTYNYLVAWLWKCASWSIYFSQQKFTNITIPSWRRRILYMHCWKLSG